MYYCNEINDIDYVIKINRKMDYLYNETIYSSIL